MVLDTLLLGLQAGFGAAIVRNVVGYIKKAMEDGHFSDYEKKMLGVTVLTNVLYATIFILLGFGFDEAVGLSVISDVVINSMTKK